MKKHKRKFTLDYNVTMLTNKTVNISDSEENEKPKPKIGNEMKEGDSQHTGDEMNKDEHSTNSEEVNKTETIIKKAKRQSVSTMNNDDDDGGSTQEVSLTEKIKGEESVVRYHTTPHSRRQRETGNEQALFYRRCAPPAPNMGNNYNGLSVWSPFCRRRVAGPLYRDFQLLGDSQFVRFTRKILQERFCGRSVNYCVTGQRIGELHQMLCKKMYNVHPFVMVLIGTNDLKMTKITSDEMIKSYNDLLNVLKSLTEKIILLTVPPVYMRADSIKHWQTLEEFNNYILRQHDGEKIFVVDLGVHLTGYQGNKGIKDYYEQTYYASDNPDLLHLNIKGLRLMKFLLDLHYFDCNE